MATDYVGLNRALFGGGGGALPMLANTFVTVRGQDINRDLVQQELAQRDRGMSLDYAYRNDVLSEDSRQFDAEQERMKQVQADLMDLEGRKLEVDRMYKEGMVKQYEGVANAQNAQARQTDAQTDILLDDRNIKKQAEAAAKVFSRAETDISRIMRDQQVNYNTAIAQYAETPAGQRFMNLAFNSVPYQRVTGSRPYTAQGRAFNAVQPVGNGQSAILVEAADGTFAPFTPDAGQAPNRSAEEAVKVPNAVLMEQALYDMSMLSGMRNLEDTRDLQEAYTAYQGNIAQTIATMSQDFGGTSSIPYRNPEPSQPASPALGRALFAQQVSSLPDQTLNVFEDKAVSPEGKLDAASERKQAENIAANTVPLNALEKEQLNNMKRERFDRQLDLKLQALEKAGGMKAGDFLPRLMAKLQGIPSIGAESWTSPEAAKEDLLITYTLNADELGLPADPADMSDRDINNLIRKVQEYRAQSGDSKPIPLSDQWFRSMTLGNPDSTLGQYRNLDNARF